METQTLLIRNHIKENGIPEGWQADTVEWRKEVNRHHRSERSSLTEELSKICDELIAGLLEIYTGVTGRCDQDRVLRPDLEDRLPLVAAAGTFAFDLPRDSWRRWFGRRRHEEEVIEGMKALLRTEARELYDQIETQNNLPYFNTLRSNFLSLIEAHRSSLLDLFDRLDRARASGSVQSYQEELRVFEEKVVSTMNFISVASESLENM